MTHKTVSAESLKALEYVLMAVLVAITYNIGKKGIEQSNDKNLKIRELSTRLAGGVAVIGVIALFLGYVSLGTSSDCSDADPLYGGCTTSQDFKPTSQERLATASYFVVLLGLPYLYGGYVRWTAIRSGAAQKESDNELAQKKLAEEESNKRWEQYVKDNPDLFKNN